MLHFLRKGVKSLPAKILIGLLVASFAVWGIGDIFTFRLDTRVAKVGNTEIPAQRFADALAREQRRITQQTGQFVSYDMLRAAGLDRGILSSLIRDAAFNEELIALGIAAPDRAVADAIQANPAFQDFTGRFSDPQYKLFLAQQGFSPAGFEALTRTVLSQQVLAETTEAAMLPAPGASARIAAWRGESRGITMLTLPLAMAPDPGAPDEGALRAFYEANEAMFTEPERRWGEYLHVDAAGLRQKLTPDEATLRAAYEADIDAYTVEPSRVIDQITIPDRVAAEAATARLISGAATFESLGAEFGLEAGDLVLGRVTRGDLPDSAAVLIFDAAEPGIVGPVGLPAGFAIYRIKEIEPGGVVPFEDVRDLIAERLAQDEVLVRAPEIANEIDEARAEGLSMQEISRSAGEDGAGIGAAYGQFHGLARDATLADGTAAEAVVASAPFIDEVFAALDAEERDLVEMPDGGYLLIMVERIEPSALKPLAEVHDRAVTAWAAAERLKALATQGEALAARMGDDASIWDIAEELGVAAVPLEPFTRVAPPAALPAALLEQVFNAASAAGASAPDGQGAKVVVVQVTSVTALGPDAMATNSATIDQALEESLAKDMGEYFARAIVARHDARIEPGVIDEVFRRLGATSQPIQ
ncbi:MAG: SurA N-terminal domain-containing protein [Alphaproteobacteria bacterium]